MLKLDAQECGLIYVGDVGTSRERFYQAFIAWRKEVYGSGIQFDFRGTFHLRANGRLGVKIVWWGHGMKGAAVREVASRMGWRGVYLFDDPSDEYVADPFGVEVSREASIEWGKASETV